MNLEKRVAIPTHDITEGQYRQLKDRLSYSNLKTYATNRTKFYKECVLGEIREQEQTVATLIGDITHTLLSGQEFDDKFVIATATEPTGQMLDLVNALYKITLKSINSEGVQTEQFETLFIDAVNEVKYDRDLKEVKFKGKSVEKIVEMFSGTDSEIFYKEKLSCIGKTLVSINNIQSAERLAEQLKTHPYSCDIANIQTGGDIEVFTELIILYEIDGVGYRSMVDKLVVDHSKKTITPYDWKCTWSNEEGFEYNYLKNLYSIQAGLYDMAIWHWKREHGLEYKVNPMTYIAADTTSNNAPVVYKLTAQDIEMAKHGYKVRGKYYPGVLELLDNIKWHVETGIWNTSKKIYESKGVVGLEIDYEK